MSLIPLLLGFLTVVLVLDCIFLILLVLIQLPKKEAGLGGMAFGGGATEALFGAGSGTVLTKATKYMAGVFVGLALSLSVINAHRVQRDNQSLMQELKTRAAAPAEALVVSPGEATPSTTTSTPLPALTVTNVAPSPTPEAPSVTTNPPTATPE